MSEREELLHLIQTFDFAIQEAALYLDSHPCSKIAMRYYQHYKHLSEKATREYEECYGPLTNKSNDNRCKWQWINDPWPWEQEA